MNGKTLAYLALPVLMLGVFAAHAQSNPAPSPLPVPETGGGDCEEVGSNLWECCEENEDAQMTICSIAKEPYGLDRRKPFVLTTRK